MLQVIYEDEVVGDLMTEERVLSFRYRQSWLNKQDAFSLSPYLPLENILYRGDKVLFFFSNLLPEGAVLSAILKLQRLPAGDIYVQLKNFGEEVAGAFSIVEDIKSLKKPSYQIYLLNNIEKDLEKLKDHQPLLVQHQNLRLSLAGAQNKIPVKYEKGQFWLPKNGAPSTHILKPPIQPQSMYPNSVWNEALCLRVAKLCQLNTVSVEVKVFSQPVLVIERYDRSLSHGKIQRLHQLDFCQLTERLPDQKYEKDGAISLKIIFDTIDKYTDKPAINRLKALDWLLFNYIIGNADAHAKNLSVLVLPGNKIQLTPFYDILCTEIYEDVDKKMAMTIGGEYRPQWVRKENWHQLAEQLSLNVALLRNRALKLSQRMLSQLPRAIQGLLSVDESENCAIQKMSQKIEKVIQQRSQWINRRLN